MAICFLVSWNTIPQESGCLLHSGDQIPWWQLPHNQGQGHQVQALLVRKWQRHSWCRSVCGRRVDRESFWGSESLRQNYFSEKRWPGRPKMTWKQLTERDCKEWKLSAINPHDRCTWRSGVRSAMHAASQLSGRGPTDVDVAPVPAR